ncbi:MAG: tetratricopeptide repeat protein [Bacteroidetes bacterium]|nr:tetratricopeptide repeat protein [Bacteroidota bacterium]
MKKLIVLTFFLVSVFAQSQDAQNLLRLAQSFEQSSEFERAADLYHSLYQNDTLNYSYFDGLRRCYLQLKQYDNAIALTRSRLTIMPFDFTLQASLGGIYYMSGSETKADSVWNAVLLSGIGNQMLYRAVAGEQVNQRLFDKAIATYLSGRKKIGDPFLFAGELGYYYTFMMDYQNAAKEYLLLLKQNPQQMDFVQSRLAQFASKKDGLSAIQHVLQEENKKNGNDVGILRLLQWSYMEDANYADAFAVSKTLEEKIHTNGTEIFSFAERAFRENSYTVAASAYTLALQLGPKMPFASSAKYGYARCVEELSLPADSITRHQQRENSSLLETQPTFNAAVLLYESIVKEYPYTSIAANALYRIGWIRYKQLFDLDGALQMFDSVVTVVRVGPMIPQVLSTVGDLYEMKGEFSSAEKKYYELSVSQFSTPEQKTTGEFRLAEIQYFQGRFDSANVLFGKITENLKADETNDALLLQNFINENKTTFPEALRNYAHAELLARQLKLSEAIVLLTSTISAFADAPLCDDALIKIADYSIVLKRFSDALTAYKKILSDYPKSIEIEKTQFKIAELYQFYLNDKAQAIQQYELLLEKYPLSLYAESARKRIRQLRGDTL